MSLTIEDAKQNKITRKKRQQALGFLTKIGLRPDPRNTDWEIIEAARNVSKLLGGIKLEE